MTETHILTDILNFNASQCNKSLAICKKENNPRLDYCMRLLQECSIICRITALLVDTRSQKQEQYLRESVRLCEACAVECAKHGASNEFLSCALACRNCSLCCSEQLTGIAELRYAVC